MAAGEPSLAARPASASEQCGLTLLELLVAVALIGVLLTLAVPSIQSIIERYKINAAAADLFAAIMLTRAEAIRRGGSVELVPGDGTDWAKGWTITTVESQPSPGSGAGGAQIVRVHGPVGRGIVINSVMKDSASPYVAYGAYGRSRTRRNGQVPQAGHFALRLGQQQRRIVLNFVGRPRLCDPSRELNCD